MIQSQLSMDQDWEQAPPLPAAAMAIDSICGINEKAQKLEDMLRESGKVNIELAEHVIKQSEESKRRARRSTYIEWDKLIELARIPVLKMRIAQAKKHIEDEQKINKKEGDREEQAQVTERQIVVSKAKEGRYTLTPKQKAEIERMIAEGGTKPIRISEAKLLINATGAEKTGVETAYSDLHCFSATTSTRQHIAETLSPICGEELLMQVP